MAAWLHGWSAGQLRDPLLCLHPAWMHSPPHRVAADSWRSGAAGVATSEKLAVQPYSPIQPVASTLTRRRASSRGAGAAAAGAEVIGRAWSLKAPILHQDFKAQLARTGETGSPSAAAGDPRSGPLLSSSKPKVVAVEDVEAWSQKVVGWQRQQKAKHERRREAQEKQRQEDEARSVKHGRNQLKLRKRDQERLYALPRACLIRSV
jgi:hypothetical protein